MMDLQELRIQRTPVTPNSKCESCVHYDGNAAAKGGACEVGTAPALCGTGIDRKYGYAPLAELGPDEIDDLATPCVNGHAGTVMNEHGGMEPVIQMKRVTLGDEDMTIAQRIAGDISKNMAKSDFMWQSQGEVSRHCGQELAEQMRGKHLPLAYLVAKSLRDLHFAPRKQRKYDLEAVLDFLREGGMHVGDDSYEVAGIMKGRPVNESGGDPRRMISQPDPTERSTGNSIPGPGIKPKVPVKPDWLYGAGGAKAPVVKALPDVSRGVVKVSKEGPNAGKIAGPKGTHPARLPLSHANPNPVANTDQPKPQSLKVGSAPSAPQVLKSIPDVKKAKPPLFVGGQKPDMRGAQTAFGHTHTDAGNPAVAKPGFSGVGRAALPIAPGHPGHVPEVWAQHGPKVKKALRPFVKRQ